MGVTLNGHLNVPADRVEDIRAALHEHIRLTRAEAGCIRFDVHENPDHPGQFIVSEEFQDPAAFDAHQARVQSSDWGRISAGLERDYKITGLKK